MLAVILILIFSVAKDYDFNFKTNFYFQCNKFSCENPIMSRDTHAYNSYTRQDLKKDCLADWCKKEFLPRGEYGIKPPDSFIFKYLNPISFFLFGISIYLNHLIHNRGKKFGIKLNLSDKWLNKLKKLSKKVDELEDD